MRKFVTFSVLLSMLNSPVGVLAQEASSPDASSPSLPPPGFLSEAITHGAARATQAPAVARPTGEVPHRSWVARHPVGAGALIGSAGPWTFLGTGIGACVGHLVSAKQKKYDAAVSSQPDLRAVKRLVALLGPGKQIDVVKGNGDHVKGHVGGLGSDDFSILPEGQTASVPVTYANVRSIRGKPMSAGAKVGIAACIAGPIIGFGLLAWVISGEY